jgi:hypothetical protein
LDLLLSHPSSTGLLLAAVLQKGGDRGMAKLALAAVRGDRPTFEALLAACRCAKSGRVLFRGRGLLGKQCSAPHAVGRLAMTLCTRSSAVPVLWSGEGKSHS